MFNNCYPGFNNVFQTCEYEDIPNYVNYHTHMINNQIKRHVNIPTFSNSCETRVFHEYDPMMQFMNIGPSCGGYNQPMYANQEFMNNQQPSFMNPSNNQPFYNQQMSNEGMNNFNNFFVPFPYRNN